MVSINNCEEQKNNNLFSRTKEIYVIIAKNQEEKESIKKVKEALKELGAHP